MTRRLLDRGHPVIACDDFSIGTCRDAAGDVTWEQLDVSAEGMTAILDRHTPDVVLHGAAHPGGRSMAEPSASVRVNALGSMRVFEWCARRQVPVVFLSSSVVYGEQPPRPIPESAPPHPGTVYGVCKVACEGFLRALEAGQGLQWTVLRLFATYGAGHQPGLSQGIVNVMLTQLLAGNRVAVRGALTRVRDLVYVDDAAEAVVACLLEPRARQRVLNVGTGREATVRDVIAILARLLGRPMETVELIEEPPVVGDPFYNVADTDAMRAVTGFVPRVPLEDGLARLVSARMAR